MVTGDFNETHTRGTTSETLEFQTEMQPRQDTSEDLQLPIIITSSIVGLLLIVIFVCLITRLIKRKEKQGNKRSTTEVNMLTDLYSEPIPGAGESKMKTMDHINAEEEPAYSVTDSKENEYSQPLINRDNNGSEPTKAVTSTDSEYADTDLGEYDVLRGQRMKLPENASSHCEIYDRTNNVVTGIYDVTSNTQNENEYSMVDNDLK
ncbi:uncharacterized protein LOC133194444 [Saccostrea echinata]|uniref:uncharacterized protein LOC133194444 n=1 Tax=Saccostrea echinata TaxID=191078 RepID=UPI002A7F8629|nr:uncharacterized protein LOC133194444 [Saccostrea echinata]